METTLIIVFAELDGTISPGALESVSAAQSLSQSGFAIGLIGESIQPALAQFIGCGASRCLAVTGPDFAQPRYATDSAAAEALIRVAGSTLVIAASTPRAQRVLPGVAHRLGGRADTHVTTLSAVDGQPSVTRWYYRQRMEGTFQRAQRPWLLLVEPGCSAACPSASDAPMPAVESLKVEVSSAHQRTQVIGRQAPPADQQTIRPEADVLFVAGAGWTKKQADGQPHVADAERLILDFLRKSRASLGSSKSLVDISGEGQAVLSCLSHMNQIGQTGATPRHPKGLSTCCHGEEPHAVGWRFIRERRAINLDPNCGWARGKADVLYVADAFAVIEKVNALLAQHPS